MKASDLEEVKSYSSGDLHVSNHNLTSLEGCPKIVTGDFRCRSNKLTSLEGCPTKVMLRFSCRSNKLTSFEHFPKYIGEHCYIGNNHFTSFKDIDQHIEYIGGNLFARNMDITSGMLDLFGIDGLQGIGIDNNEIRYIANKYLPEKDLINFQDEMIKSGYERYL